MREQDLKNFILVNSFLGYRNKRDVVKEERGVAVSGSQNCIIIDGEKIGVRPGFSYVGGRSADRYGIQGGGSWKNSSGDQIMWRSYYNGSNGVLEVLNGSTWETLIDTLTSGKVRATSFWDTTEETDLLTMVNGTPNIYAWSGAVATYSSATSNTITKQGTSTWGAERFFASGTRGIRVKDDSGVWREANYTGGEGTTTLTGLTVDLTAYSISEGAPIFQTVRVTANKPSAEAKNDFCITYLNQLFVFNETSNIVLASKLNDYTDFSTLSSPRIPGDIVTLTLDETPTGVAVAPTGSALYITTRNYYYTFVFVDSADLTTQSFNIQPTYIPNGGATNNLAVSNIKNFITMITNEPSYDLLGNVLNNDTIQTNPVTDEIKNFMDTAVVDEASSGYYKNKSYLSLKSSNYFGSNNNIIVYDLKLGHWETPWTLPGLKPFEHNGELYIHDPSLKNTFKLLGEYSDGKNGTIEGAPISAKWFSSWDNYELPFNHKKFDTMWIDGYITPNTKLDIYLSYDFGAFTQKFTLLGTKDGVILETSGGGLGYYSLGNRSLGGRGETLEDTGLRRFRGFIKVAHRTFYELQTSFQSNGVNYRWEVVEYGFNITSVPETNNNLLIN